MLATLLAHQTNGALSDFGGKLAWLAHGSILSRVGASIKSGAVHDVINELKNEGFDFSSIQSSIKQLQLAFQIRHMGIHNMGIVDANFNSKTGRGVIGNAYPVDQKNYIEMYDAYTTLLKHMDDNLPSLLT